MCVLAVTEPLPKVDFSAAALFRAPLRHGIIHCNYSRTDQNPANQNSTSDIRRVFLFLMQNFLFFPYSFDVFATKLFTKHFASTLGIQI